MYFTSGNEEELEEYCSGTRKRDREESEEGSDEEEDEVERRPSKKARTRSSPPPPNKQMDMGSTTSRITSQKYSAKFHMPGSQGTKFLFSMQTNFNYKPSLYYIYCCNPQVGQGNSLNFQLEAERRGWKAVEDALRTAREELDPRNTESVADETQDTFLADMAKAEAKVYGPQCCAAERYSKMPISGETLDTNGIKPDVTPYMFNAPRLPPDVISEILSHAAPPVAPTGTDNGYERKTSDVPWQLALINQTWRQCVLESRKLWTYLTLDGADITDPEVLARLEYQLERFPPILPGSLLYSQVPSSLARFCQVPFPGSIPFPAKTPGSLM
ncbi:hypothetical protein FB451DRAFT_1192404 [Mycena latifolia]|nr:hypothetical protein FB451DRAFT_1192404 [Mycena latifolia]